MEKYLYIVKSQEMMGTKIVAIFDDEKIAKNYALNYAPATWYDKVFTYSNKQKFLIVYKHFSDGFTYYVETTSKFLALLKTRREYGIKLNKKHLKIYNLGELQGIIRLD